MPEAPKPSARRRCLLMLAAGAIVLAASLTAPVLALTRDSDETVDSIGNAIAAIAEDGGTVIYTEAGNTPSTIAVGAGAVWVLNADDQTISKIDPKTREIVKTFGTGGVTTDLAVGEGAVWVGNGAETAGTFGDFYTGSVSRFDPGSTTVRETEVLPSLRPGAISAGEYRVLGVSQLAVGAGAVWAINPDLTASRINPETGAREAIIPVEAGSAIAAGTEGVWVIAADAPHLLRVDPRTNKLARGSSWLRRLA